MTYVALTLRTDEELDNALDALALAEGTSKQDVIRRAVLDRYDRSVHSAAVERSTSKMLDRWGDVLERLGKA